MATPNNNTNVVNQGSKPRLGVGKPMGLAQPGDRARLASNNGPELGSPARPGSQSRGARPAKPSKSGGSVPRVARPGSGAVNRKPQAKAVSPRSRVR